MYTRMKKRDRVPLSAHINNEAASLSIHGGGGRGASYSFYIIRTIRPRYFVISTSTSRYPYL
jgi:hypothetical protein